MYKSIVTIFISEWSNPAIFNENELIQREPLSRIYQPQNKTYDTLDEQLLQTKQWLLERTLNLR